MSKEQKPEILKVGGLFTSETYYGVPVYIYKARLMPDHTRGGVTSSVNRGILIWNGCPQLSPSHPVGCPPLFLKFKMITDENAKITPYFYASPVPHGRNEAGLAFGGNFIHYPQNFPFLYPIPVHDRVIKEADNGEQNTAPAILLDADPPETATGDTEAA